MIPRQVAAPARQRGSQARALLSVVRPQAPGALACRASEQKSLPLDGTRCRHMPFAYIRAAANDSDEMLALSCKRWRCEDCGPGLKKRLRTAFQDAIAANPDLRRFFTLTMPGKTRQLDLEGRYVALSKAFAAFRKRMAKIQGRAFPYALVREPHRDGTPHIHGLTDRFVPFAQLRQVWADCGGGYVDIRFVDPHRAAAYLSKYLSKDGNPPPKGMRKYAAGGGVALVNVRPKGKGGHHLEVKTGSGEWIVPSDSGEAFMQLKWLTSRDRERERLAHRHEAARELNVRLRAEAARVAALRAARAVPCCVVCGGAHEVHA